MGKGVPIGLDNLVYATITDGVDGTETYGTPKPLAEAITAGLSVELIEAILYADDSASEVVKEFKQGKLSLKVKDIGTEAAADLTGATVDKNGVLVSRTEDVANPVAIGFRARKSNGKYRYYWLYRVTFGIPGAELQTKGDSVNFATPAIEGVVVRRKKADTKGGHPWKAEVNEDDTSVVAATITGWFTQVYEPTYPTTGA